MVSAGNDIVSLAEIDPIRTKQPAFYRKIISDSELIQYQKLAVGTVPFEVYVWLLWSVKEAAFKFLRRLNSQLVFSPSKFIVGDIQLLVPSGFKHPVFDQVQGTDNTTWQGNITVNNIDLTYFSYVGTYYVHSVIHPVHNSAEIYSGVKQIAEASTQNQSSEVRDLCLDKVEKLKPGTRFNVTKSEQGVPSIYNIDEDLSYPVSFSHHGRFVACSFLM